MKVKVIASTHPNYKASKEAFDIFGGHAAGVCYMQSDFKTLRSEDKEKTLKRVKLCKDGGHHSVFDHTSVTLYLDKIPRVIEMLLDNERYMVSSVKSGRYTLHPLPAKEQVLYDKWYARFKQLIRDEYAAKFPKFFTESRIDKLALENARYVTGMFTLVSMVHTTSYRQLNYVYGFIRDFLAKDSDNKMIKKLKPYLVKFLAQLDKTGYIDEALVNNGKGRVLSVFNEYKPSEYFGDVYCARYECSIAVFMHLNRHRTLKHHIGAPVVTGFYVPELIRDDKELHAEWLCDLRSVKANWPQAMMVEVSEMGNLDDFILKVIERKCSVVMLETTRVVNDLLIRYHRVLDATQHARAADLGRFLQGSKCLAGVKCAMPCAFTDGVKETRKV